MVRIISCNVIIKMLEAWLGPWRRQFRKWDVSIIVVKSLSIQEVYLRDGTANPDDGALPLTKVRTVYLKSSVLCLFIILIIDDALFRSYLF